MGVRGNKAPPALTQGFPTVGVRAVLGESGGATNWTQLLKRQSKNLYKQSLVRDHCSKYNTYVSWWSTTTYESDIFRRYARRVAGDNPLNSEADYERLYKSLARLNSFTSKGPVGKLMRWFAWNQQCQFHIDERAALEMLLDIKPNASSIDTPERL